MASLRHKSFLVACLFAMFMGLCAFPTGAPKQACTDAAPLHRTRAGADIKSQTGASPYSFTADAKTYKPGQKITVTIEGSQTFGGFLIQARQVGGGKTPVGSFSEIPPNAQLRGCNTSDDGVTHTNPNPKLPGMKFSWSTKEGAGVVEFFGTVAKDHDVFWSGIKSAAIEPATADSSFGHLKFEAVDEEVHHLEDEAKAMWRQILMNKTMALEGALLRKQRQRHDKL